MRATKSIMRCALRIMHLRRRFPHYLHLLPKLLPKKKSWGLLRCAFSRMTPPMRARKTAQTHGIVIFMMDACYHVATCALQLAALWWHLHSLVLCRIILRWYSSRFPGRWGIITEKDLECLEPNKMLTDTMISFYVNHLVDFWNPNSASASAKFFFFNSFFYTKMKTMRMYQETGEAHAKRSKVCLLCLCASCVSAHLVFSASLRPA